MRRRRPTASTSTPSPSSRHLSPRGVIAIEDLIPLPIGIAAVKHYAQEFLDPAEAAKLRSLHPKDVNFEGCSGTHDALERAALAPSSS